jgi:glycine cleavage system regulatory protein
MKTHLVFAAIGPDRPGLVHAIAQEVTAAGGDWLGSRLAALAGQFAGVVEAAVPAENVDALTARLRALEPQRLRFVVEQGGRDLAGAGGRIVQLELLGQDHPGIVRDVAQLLAARKVSVEELETDSMSGAFSGEAMFKARARLRVPGELTTGELRGLLEALANELMVDVTVEERQAGGG